MEKYEACYKEGVEAFVSCQAQCSWVLGLFTAPYTIKTLEYMFWKAGWDNMRERFTVRVQ